MSHDTMPDTDAPAGVYIEEIALNGGAVRLRLRGSAAGAAGDRPTPAAVKEAARIITPVWGDRYVDYVLTVMLPALLAPGNVPVLTDHFDCEYFFVTETRLFERFLRSPAVAKLLRHCPVRLVPVDDLLCTHWGITVTYAFMRGFDDLGADATKMHLFFNHADFIMADGSFRKALEAVKRGERLIVSPSYCLVMEETVDHIRGRVDEASSVLSIPHREMADLILRHRHNYMRAKTANQRLFRLHWHDQFYWYVDEHTLLARQMPIAVVYMRIERFVPELPTFWDYGMLSELCPTLTPCVLGDSDDFLMAELRPKEDLKAYLQLGWPSLDELGTMLSRHLTKDHHDYGRHTLVLHSKDLPDDIEIEKKNLGDFMNEVYRRLSPPVSYKNHKFWADSFPRFSQMRAEGRERLDAQVRAWEKVRSSPGDAQRRKRMGMLRAQINAARTVARTSQPTTEDDRMTALSVRLAALDQAYRSERASVENEMNLLGREPDGLTATCRTAEQELDRLIGERQRDVDLLLGHAEAEAQQPAAPVTLTGQSCSAEAAPRTDPGQPALAQFPRGLKSRIRSLLGWTFRAIFGSRLTQLTEWHPYYTSVRLVTAAVLKVASAPRILLVTSEREGPAVLPNGLRPARSVTVPAVMAGGFPGDLGVDEKFDACLCFLTFDDLMKFRAVADRVRPLVRARGKMILFFHNREIESLDKFTFIFTEALFPLVGKSVVSFTGSRLGALVTRHYSRALAALGVSRRRGGLLYLATLAVCAPLSRVAAAREKKSYPGDYPAYCTSMTVEIELI